MELAEIKGNEHTFPLLNMSQCYAEDRNATLQPWTCSKDSADSSFYLAIQVTKVVYSQ